MFLGGRNWIEGVLSLSNLSGRGRKSGEGGEVSVLFCIQFMVRSEHDLGLLLRLNEGSS